MEQGRPRDHRLELLANLALAAGVAVLGVLVLWKTGEIRLTPVNSRVGPRVIPYIVGGGLVFTGLWLAVDVLRGNLPEPDVGEDAEDIDVTLPTDWVTVGIVSAALLVYYLLIERAGFVIASALLFVIAAYGMGSRKIVRDSVIGVLLSAGAYLLFTEGLSIRLPQGWLEGVL